MHIEITILGYVVLATSIFLLIYSRKAMPFLMLSILSSIFQDASFINITTTNRIYPITIYYLPMTMFIFKALAEKLPTIELKRTLRFSMPLILFVIWAITSAYLLPLVFQGIHVFPPHKGIDASAIHTMLLSFSSTNLVQTIYITFYLIFFITGATYISKNPQHLEKCIKAMKLTIPILLVIAIYQLIANKYQLPSINLLIHSSLRHINTIWQPSFIESIPTTSATFREPSYLGYYLTGLFGGIMWQHINHNASLKKNQMPSTILLLLTIILLASLSLSTTALLGIFTVSALLFFYTIYKNTIPLSIKFIKTNILILIPILLTAIFLLPIFYNEILQTLMPAIANISINKVATDSYIHRHASNVNAIILFFKTYGLGVGLGSDRPSSLLPMLLSNVGILGISAILVFGKKILCRLNKTRAFLPTSTTMDYTCFLTGSISGYIIAGIISVPDLTFPYIWINLSILTGLIIQQPTKKTKIFSSSSNKPTAKSN